MQYILGRIPPNIVLFYALLSFAVPYVILRCNRLLHKYGDPPWKQLHGAAAGGEEGGSGQGQGPQAQAQPQTQTQTAPKK